MTRLNILIGIVALLIGFALGVQAQAWFYSYLRSDQPYSRVNSEATVTHRALASIRTGDTNAAIEELERFLDVSLLTLSKLDQMPNGEAKREITENLAKLKAYRQQYPRHYDSQFMKDGTARALSFAGNTEDAP